mmetsp:Transcript_26338/g.86434  ORF Transcript_26338/g.86434 Transcript_26338/m.86434 type:complete len:319 (+) Transcript_26338:1661-2617(+)
MLYIYFYSRTRGFERSSRALLDEFAPALGRLLLHAPRGRLPAARRDARARVHEALERGEETAAVQRVVPPPRNDAIVALERRAVVCAVRLTRDEHPRLLQREYRGVQLARFAVRPRVELLREPDHERERGPVRSGWGAHRERERERRARHERLAHLVEVVRGAALCDGPRKAVVALERIDDAAHHRRRLRPKVVHRPVEHPNRQVRRPPSENDRSRAEREVPRRPNLRPSLSPQHQVEPERRRAPRDVLRARLKLRRIAQLFAAHHHELIHQLLLLSVGIDGCGGGGARRLPHRRLHCGRDEPALPRRHTHTAPRTSC